jgi:hypothetical protein
MISTNAARCLLLSALTLLRGECMSLLLAACAACAEVPAEARGDRGAPAGAGPPLEAATAGKLLPDVPVHGITPARQHINVITG